MDFIDLKAQQQRIRPSLDKRIARVLDHGRYILGPEIDELEDKLAQYAGCAHCVTCASGTDALLMGLMALGAGPGDAVFVPSFTFVATAEVVVLAGAVPVFVDSAPDTFNISAEALRAAITEILSHKTDLRPAGIIAVDLFGQSADYDELSRIAQEHGLWLMEDAAQSFGANYQGKRTCSFGQAAATSFFPAKPLGCYGDGGAVFVNDRDLADKLRSIRVHGQGTDKYDNVRIGINGRMDTLQAAVLLSKLEIFDEELELRNLVARRYQNGLQEKFVTPFVAANRTSVWAQYSLLTANRETCLRTLKDHGIPAAIYYPIPIHRQAAYRHFHHGPSLPVCEDLAERIFSIPMHPYLSTADQQIIIDVLNSSV